MRSRLWSGVVLIGCTGVLAVGLGTATVAAKTSAEKLHVDCKATAYNVDFPKLSGLAFAHLHCTKPFGFGVQNAHSTTSIVGSTVHVTGSFTNFFDDGTDSGTVKMSGRFSAGTVSVKGTVTLTRGTGAYKHIRGTGPVSCTTADAGKTFHCTVKGTARL